MNVIRLKKFLEERCGAVLAETLLTFPIVFLLIAVSVEFVFVMYQWNIASKAMQLAARRIAVTAPFVDNYDDIFNIDQDSIPGGSLIQPNSQNNVSCGAGTDSPCNATAMQFLIGPHDPPVGDGWYGLASYYQQLDPSTIMITYEQNGLGFVGRPSGPVTTARLEFDNATFNTPIIGGFLNIVGFELPPFTVTITTEDLSNCPLNAIPVNQRTSTFRCEWS